MGQCFCEKCKRTMSDKEFYGSHNLEKYPSGKLNQCKKCITMHVNNWDPSTYLWILQECDVPYVQREWDKLLADYGADPKKVTGTTIIGRYLSKMRLTQYKDKRWKDNEIIRRLEEKKMREAMTHQGYSSAQIDEAIANQMVTVPAEHLEEPQLPGYITPNIPAQPEQPIGDGYTSATYDDSSDLGIELSDEEIVYLRTKWGKSYKPDEWVQLESLYQNMMDSYDVQGAGHEDTLKLACKTSLKSNQLLDMGDIDSAKKMVSMYDQLMKSGNFTAAQNKKDKGEFIDSISELVELCEKDGFIPRYYTDSPKDRVDETILDLQNYTKTLVVEEMNLGNLIEGAVREMVREENKEEDEDIDDELLDFDSIEEIKDQDFDEFNDFVEEESTNDEEAIAAIVKSGLK
jgi:hypothetical protein